MRNTRLSMDVGSIGSEQLEWKSKSNPNTNMNMNIGTTINMEESRNLQKMNSNFEIEHSRTEPGSVSNVCRVDYKSQASQLMEMNRMMKLASDTSVITKIRNTGLTIVIDDEEWMNNNVLTPTDNVCVRAWQSPTDQYESKDTDHADRCTPSTYAYTDEGSSSPVYKHISN